MLEILLDSKEYRVLCEPKFTKIELEHELIQTQMAQKPMLRAEVYAHAMRASQNRVKEVRREKEVLYFQPSLKWKLFMNKFEIIKKGSTI